MNIFRLHADGDNYEGVVAVDEKDFAAFEEFDGSSLQGRWRSPTMRPYGLEIPGTQKERKLPPSDFPISYFSSSPIFSGLAVDVLGSLLTEAGELFPLDCPGRDYYVYNVTRLVDALNEEKSIVKRFKESGQIFRIVEHCFRPEPLAGVHVFKLPQLRASDVYVDDKFADLVAEAKLKGFLFEMVWHS